MDLRKVKKLISLFEESHLLELEIESEGENIRMSRRADPSETLAPMAAYPATAEPQPTPAEDDPGEPVVSPIVGTYYARPNPNAPPFTAVGDTVKTGDTLCIVEAMKVMNQIKAERAGRIIAIKVEDQQPVEFGQVLMLME